VDVPVAHPARRGVDVEDHRVAEPPKECCILR
jgi:hypothetical protein